MFLSTFAKFGAGAGTVAGTIYLGDTLIDDTRGRQIFKKVMDKVETLEDIELLEAMKGCSFDFVASWNSNKTYKAKKYHENLPEEKRENYKKKMIQQVGQKINECKPGAYFSFSWNIAQDDFYMTNRVIG